MENNRDLLEEDIEMLTIKELKEYSMEEILRTLKYLYKKNEELQDEIDYEHELSLGWDI